MLDAARRSGVSIDYVETNSSWFKEPEPAEALLSGLRRKGLHTLLVSISPFHNEHIPHGRPGARHFPAPAAHAGVGAHPGGEYGFRSQQTGYINKCDQCTEIRFSLVKEG